MQVTNTPWGERVTFLFDPNGDSVAKPLHVSPFMVPSPTCGCINVLVRSPRKFICVEISLMTILCLGVCECKGLEDTKLKV